MAVFGPPNVAKLEAAGKIDGLVRAARYKKDPAGGRPPRARALTGYLDKIIQRLDTKNIVQLNTSREALVIIGPPARDRLIFILREGHVHRRQDAAYVLGMMGTRRPSSPLCVGDAQPRLAAAHDHRARPWARSATRGDRHAAAGARRRGFRRRRPPRASR